MASTVLEIYDDKDSPNYINQLYTGLIKTRIVFLLTDSQEITFLVWSNLPLMDPTAPY